jgi:hypothetical protein
MAVFSDSLHDTARDLHIVPIRHHSPACAVHLRALLEEVRPAHVLIEGPCDFDALIPLITDVTTRPPVAVVSIDERKGVAGEIGKKAISYFPFCTHSPEYVALSFAKTQGIPASFIDLPMADQARHEDVDPSTLLTDETRLDSSDYVRALCREFSCRDGSEVWDHLFETQLHHRNWRRFFREVAIYCGHIRASTDEALMKADGTLAREAQMSALIASARASISGPIVAVVGGFHAGALLTPSQPAKGPRKSGRGTQAYLVRYGHRQLNALAGYSAGLPLPGYYEGLWLRRDEELPYGSHATDLIAHFAAHLRKEMPGFAPSHPTIVAAIESAHRLAELRGRIGPMRDDILDACRSVFLKGDETADKAPVMQELFAFMTGSALGDVPPSAGSPPLVEAVRRRARALGFNLDDGACRDRELDIYRKDRHREASRLLHGMVFLDTGFGQRNSGPDLRQGVDLERLFEHWSYTWSPMVEARLIELSVDGDSLETVLAVEVMRRLTALHTEGRGNDARAAIDLFVASCQAGVADRAASILPFIADEVTGDPDIVSVADSLRDLVELWRGAAFVGLENRNPVEQLVVAAWRQALFLLPNLANYGEDRITSALDALVILREVVELAGHDLDSIDTSLFDEAVAALLRAELQPAIGGAVAALACLAQKMTAEELGRRVSGELGGAYTEPKDCAAFLRGVIAVSRELLWATPSLVEAVDNALSSAGSDDFIALLPHLRLAFGRLDPRDIDRLAHVVAGRRNAGPDQVTQAFSVSEATFAANMAIDSAIAELLTEAGLA